MSNPADFLPTRGRPGTVLVFEILRELLPDEVLRLAADDGTRTRIAPPAIQRVTARHHRIAQFVAQGRTSVDIALLVGMSAQRIRDLRECDPTFRELVSAYTAAMADLAVDSGSRIRATMEDGLEIVVNELHDRLDDPAKLEKMPIGELREVGKFFADRTVAPPRQAAPTAPAPTQITFNIGGRGLSPSDAKAEPEPTTPVIEHESSGEKE